MLVQSDNASANALEVWLAGSTSAGSHRIESLLRSMACATRSCTAATSSSGTPRRHPAAGGGAAAVGGRKVLDGARSRPAEPPIWLASGGLGPLRRHAPGFTAADARYLLYLLGRVRDPGKLDREVQGVPGVRVLHKAGWLSGARHDNGLVFWRGGVYVAAVMTYRAGGTGLREDVIAGRVTGRARRFRLAGFPRHLLRDRRAG